MIIILWTQFPERTHTPLIYQSCVKLFLSSSSSNLIINTLFSTHHKYLNVYRRQHIFAYQHTFFKYTYTHSHRDKRLVNKFSLPYNFIIQKYIHTSLVYISYTTKIMMWKYIKIAYLTLFPSSPPPTSSSHIYCVPYTYP